MYEDHSMKRVHILRGHTVSPGYAEGTALVTRLPLSFHGVSMERETGIVRWKGHELEGKSVKDMIVVMDTGRGSTGGSWALYSLKTVYGTAPKGIVCRKADPITTAPAILAGIPMVDKLDQDPCEVIRTGDYVKVDATRGIVEILKADG